MNIDSTRVWCLNGNMISWLKSKNNSHLKIELRKFFLIEAIDLKKLILVILIFDKLLCWATKKISIIYSCKPSMQSWCPQLTTSSILILHKNKLLNQARQWLLLKETLIIVQQATNLCKTLSRLLKINNFLSQLSSSMSMFKRPIRLKEVIKSARFKHYLNNLMMDLRQRDKIIYATKKKESFSLNPH